MMWLDLQKAYDSIDHDHIIKCLQKLKIPTWIITFIDTALKKWFIKLRYKNEYTAESFLKRGILQGDSLSPLIFVLILETISRILNRDYIKVESKIEEEVFECNHLIFIDNLKIIAKKPEDMITIYNKTKEILMAIGLDINKDKSAISFDCNEIDYYSWM